MTAPMAATALVAPTCGVADLATPGAAPATSTILLHRRITRHPRTTANTTRRSWLWYELTLRRGHPIDLFFHDDRRDADQRRIEHTATGVCTKCPIGIARAERAPLTLDDCGVWGATDPRQRDRFRYQVHGFNTPARQTVPTIDAMAPWLSAPAHARALSRNIPTPLRDQPPPWRPPPCGEAPGAAGSRPSLRVAAPRRLVGVDDHARGRVNRARESRRQPIRSNT
ncbi:WhiB family transcriptional regulator [Mycobacterium sp. 155]|uniref:WhiB family transcriptional regulator n=1 Tax=Mycobacterium sp. 155 TaxID=1157943 RepID=UPI0009DA217A